MKILDELERHAELGRRLYVGPVGEHMGFLGYPLTVLPAIIRVARAAERVPLTPLFPSPEELELARALQELRDIGGER